MKPSVYIETTIISYLTAWPSRDVVRLSHQMLTREWWAKHRTSFDLYASDFVIDEASRGDPTAATKRFKELADIPLLPVNPAVTELAQRVAVALALPPRPSRRRPRRGRGGSRHGVPAHVELQASGQRRAGG